MNPDDIKAEPEKNALVHDHMAKAMFHLQMAYNAANNSGQKGDAWGIAVALAETHGQCQSLGVVPRA
jgi:hypothetical protein